MTTQDEKLVEEIRSSEHRRVRNYWLAGIATVVFVLLALAVGLYLQYQALENLKAQNSALKNQTAALEELIEANRKADQRLTRFVIEQHRRIEALLLEIARRAGVPVEDLVEVLEDSGPPGTGGGADSNGDDRQADNGGGNGREPKPDRPCDIRVDPVCIRTSPTPDIEISPSSEQAGEDVAMPSLAALGLITLLVVGVIAFRKHH